MSEPKRTYSIDAPDQQRLKIARAKIEGILLASDLENAAGMFGSIAPFIDRALRAEHTEAVHKPDPTEARKQ